MKNFFVGCVIALLSVMLAACLQNHQNGAREFRGDDCVACHLDDYNNAVNPVHVGVNPTTCGDCHSQFGWRPAHAGAHPEAAFRITGNSKHTGVTCVECHNPNFGSNKKGANTDCIACHIRPEIDPDHTGRNGYAWSDSKHNFCLTCHPSGVAAGGLHPEAKFPITSGKHRSIACASCHMAADGPYTAGKNVSCINDGCHPAAKINSKHGDVRDYSFDATNKHFCLRCHPSGQKN